jgi:EAL domain-containing protein (putative c-di-GMP-specific phosphodiesterase class I)
MPALLVIEARRFQRRALCRLMRAAGADKVVDAIDVSAACRVLSETENSSWIVAADPDAAGIGGLRGLAAIAAAATDIAFLLLTNRRAGGLDELRGEAGHYGLKLTAALRLPVSAEELGTLFRRLPRVAITAPELTKDELGECLRVGRLQSRFQPIVELASGRPAGCKASAFVTHMRYGEMPAASFARAMGQLGAQRVMAASLLRDAAKLVRTAHDKGLDVTVSVNIATEVLAESGDSASLENYVRTLGIVPSDLALELNEIPGPHASPHLAVNLRNLRNRGYSLAIEEGRAPLTIDETLRAHFSQVKLARAGIARSSRDAEAAKSIASTVDAAHRFGMIACAVGLETLVELDHARSIGIDLGQGSVFAELMSADEMLAWIEREQDTRSFGRQRVALTAQQHPA